MMKKYRFRKVFSSVIFGTGCVFIGMLMVPACILLTAIEVSVGIMDKLIRFIEEGR